MQPDLGIGVRHNGSDVWTVSLRGEHDIATAPHLHGVLDDLFSQGTRIILDLSEASFIDSSIIHGIILCIQHAEEDDRDEFLVVAATGSLPRRVIDLVDLTGRVPVYDDLGSALAELKVIPSGVMDGGLLA